MGIVSVVVIVMTALMMKQNQKRVKGLGLLLASGIVTLVFAILGVTLGLIIWILSGLSLKNLTQKAAENNFEAQLQSEMVAAPVEVTVTEQAAENTETEETQQM